MLLSPLSSSCLLACGGPFFLLVPVLLSVFSPSFATSCFLPQLPTFLCKLYPVFLLSLPLQIPDGKKEKKISGGFEESIVPRVGGFFFPFPLPSPWKKELIFIVNWLTKDILKDKFLPCSFSIPLTFSTLPSTWVLSPWVNSLNVNLFKRAIFPAL